MINATLFQESGRLAGCRMEGHSGWAEEGRDIVCAAASILGCTCVNALESVCGIIPEIRENENGSLWFELPEALTEAENAKAQILMGALRQGLRDLTEAYPENIHLREKERRKRI